MFVVCNLYGIYQDSLPIINYLAIFRFWSIVTYLIYRTIF